MTGQLLAAARAEVMEGRHEGRQAVPLTPIRWQHCPEVAAELAHYFLKELCEGANCSMWALW